MGRGAGCCNFKYSVNCTAPPCPSGSCCYVDTTQSISTDTLSIEANLDRFKCEDGVTENCCLAKPFSFFNKDVECGSVNFCDSAIPTIVSTDKAFALLKHSGNVIAWGNEAEGGLIDRVLVDYMRNNIKEIYAASKAFVAVSKGGEAFIWGDMHDASVKRGFHAEPTLDAHDVFNGGIIQWVTDVKSVTALKDTGTGIRQRSAFAAITTNGEVKMWGDQIFGDSGFRSIPPRDLRPLKIVAEGKTIVQIAATSKFFAALDQEGTVYIFGMRGCYDRRDVGVNGQIEIGDYFDVRAYINQTPRNAPVPYHSAYDTNKDGIVNDDDYKEIIDLIRENGGTIISKNNPNYESGFTNVKKIYSNHHAFAFLKHDGTVLVWGNPHGENNGWNTGTNHELLTNVKEIYNTDEAFLAVREDGKMVIWGNIETTENTDSDFYDQIHEVYPTKHAFGVSYFKAEPFFGGFKVRQSFQAVGSVVPGRENLMESVHPNFGASKLSNERHDFDEFTVTSLLPKLSDHFPSNQIKTDFYASNYAIHHTDKNGFFILTGNSPHPHSHHNSHTIRVSDTDSNFGNYKSDIHKLIRNPAPLDKIRMKGAKNYVFTDRATAFLVTGDTGGQRRGRFRENLFAVPDYVVSIGNHHYGGLGSTFLTDVEAVNQFDSTPILQGKQSVIGNRGQWIGLFSNNYAFCGIRFIRRNPETFEEIPIEEPPDGGLWPVSQRRDDVSYEVVVWGDENNGGFQSANRRPGEFENIFANTKDMKITYAGCHPDYCNQDTT